MIQIKDGERHFVTCASRTLKPNEIPYAVPEKECLAIIYALQKFRPYLYGRRFTIKTDHHGLRFLMKTKDMSHRLTRWSLKLQDFTFDILYSKRAEHQDADYVSRSPFPPETNEISIRATQTQHIAIDYTNWTSDDTKNSQKRDPYLKRIIEALGDPLGHPLDYRKIARKYKIIDGLLCKTETQDYPNLRLCIPSIMVRRVLSEAHGSRTAHFGQKKTIWRCLQHFYWRGMYTDIIKYVRSCHDCQCRKAPQSIEHGIMGSMDIGPDVMHTISCDIVTLPLKTQGNQYALTAVDQVSKYAFAIPMKRQDEDTVV